MQSIIQHFADIIDKLAKAEDPSERQGYENRLICSTFSVMLIMGSIASYIAGIQWHMNSIPVLILAIVLMICSIFYIYFPKLKIGESIKTHIIGIVAALIILFVFFIYYARIQILFWYLPVMIIVCSTFIVSNNIIYFYIVVETIILLIIANTFYHKNEVYIDAAYILVLTVFLCLYLFIVHISKKIHGATNRKKIEFLQREINQNQEITMLYEETIAADDSIKEQNKELNRVNTRLEETLRQLEQYAYYDSLTGLPNRRKIYDKIDELIHGTEGTDFFTVIFLDIDDFKKINDTLGHSMGDLLLVEITKRLSHMQRPGDLLGRLGGDEFAFILKGKMDSQTLRNYLSTLCDVFDETMVLRESIRVESSASMGAAIFPKDGSNRESILRATDTAMYKAKERGKKRFEIYSKEMHDEIVRKINIEKRMVQALSNNEFYMVYQPIFYCKTNELYGFEALIRWKNKDQEIILPGQFIPLAENTGFIIEIGNWVIREVCRKVKELSQRYTKKLKFSINISPIQISKEDFVERLLDIIRQFDLPDHSIQIEITESVFIENREEAIRKLNILRKNGMTISLDDFGTGYSSLSYLIDLPLDSIKIDKSFVDLIGSGDSRERLINAVIGISFSMRTDVIAEGVETFSQLEYLRKRNCDYVQGYLLGRPMDTKQMDEFLSGFLISQE